MQNWRNNYDFFDVPNWQSNIVKELITLSYIVKELITLSNIVKELITRKILSIFGWFNGSKRSKTREHFGIFCIKW